jgi:hypothetical protein
MRAPSDSFKRALDAYVLARQQAFEAWQRERGVPSASGQTQALAPWSFTGADRKLVDRWRADDRAEGLWRAIAEQSDKISTAELIRIVLGARRSAQASVNRVRMFEDELSAVLPAVKKRLAKLSSPPSNLGPLQAQEARDLRRYHFNFRDHLGLPGQQKFELSRKDQAGSRVRRLFVQIVSHQLHERCGKWFDEQVAPLTEIAFPRGKELDVEDVRKARTRRAT